MSQYPPQPPQYPPQPPPPGFGAPPPGYGAPQGYPQPGASRGNGLAVTSLICGIIGCFVITPILAILFGAMGIRKANREPMAGGKGMAIGGIVLGILWLGIFGLFGGGIMALISGTSTQREIARSFVKAISAGDATTAQTYCTSDISAADLTALAAQAKGWGTLKDTTAIGITASKTPAQSLTVVAIQAQYSNGIKTFQCELVKENGTWKIRSYHVQ